MYESGCYHIINCLLLYHVTIIFSVDNVALKQIYMRLFLCTLCRLYCTLNVDTFMISEDHTLYAILPCVCSV